MSNISLRACSVSALVLAAALVFMIGCSPAAQAPAAQAPASQGGTQAGPDQVNTKAPFETKGNPKYGGVLHRAQVDDPPNFDLYSNSTNAMQNVTWPAYNNLVIFDPYDFSKVIPDLAEKWDVSSDGRQITFHLRQGVKFSNGTPMTAKDVKFSFDWMRDPPNGLISTRQGGLEPVDKIDVVDDATARFTLKRAYAGFMPTLAQGWMAIYSKDFVESKGDPRIMEKQIMGTGAFKLKEYVRGTSVTLEKNPNYWQPGVPYLDGEQMFLIPDPGTRFAAFRTGQLDLFSLNAEQENQIRTTMADKINIQYGDSISWQTLNMNAKRKPFDNMQVRQAISYAMDRPGYIKAIQGGLGKIGGYVPPTSQYALPPEELAKLPGYGPDAAANKVQAKKLLADAGFPNGFDTTFTVRKGSEDLAVYLTDQLKQIGINAPMKILDSGPAYDAAVKLEFDMLPWGHGLALDDPDAHYSELYVCGAARDYSGMCDAKVTELYTKQSQELDPAKRKPLVWDLEKYAIPQQIKIILSWSKAQLGTWNYVKGYVQDPSAGGYNVQHAKQIWIDK